MHLPEPRADCRCERYAIGNLSHLGINARILHAQILESATQSIDRPRPGIALIAHERLRDGDYQAWRTYPAQSVEDSGQQEILNWLCLVGALSALERKPQETGFVDTWIFNSSKAFLIAPPG